MCEVYKLHRETFYLAQDFFDRYMATQQDVVKTLLQLIGISSLFIAAKLEVNDFQLSPRWHELFLELPWDLRTRRTTRLQGRAYASLIWGPLTLRHVQKVLELG